MIKIFVPKYLEKPIAYAMYACFDEYYGIDYTLHYHECDDFLIKYKSDELRIKNEFFKLAKDNWLRQESLPKNPPPRIKIEDPIFSEHMDVDIPVIYGSPIIRIKANSVSQVDIDIFGSAFFMLTRYEESVIKSEDMHKRFQAKDSTSVKGDYLDRPIITEYYELLWAAIISKWPFMKRKDHVFSKSLSCDVDSPFVFESKSIVKSVRLVAGDLFARGDLKQALKSTLNYVYSKANNYSYDDHYTFGSFMDSAEKSDQKVTFNFICSNSAHKYDGMYSISEKRIINLIKFIKQRGHDIGMHGSYDSYNSEDVYRVEFNRLKRVLDKEGISQSEVGNRQHYLRWDNMRTAKLLNDVGIGYDSTLGYPSMIGFRCGVCHKFTMFDLGSMQMLSIKQKPLMIMDVTLLDKQYMDLQRSDQAIAVIDKTVTSVKKYKGELSILWHNSNMVSEHEQNVFNYVVGL
jgi:hypothetical protein